MPRPPDIHQQLLTHATACRERDLLLAQVVELRDAGKMRQARALYAKAEKLQKKIVRIEGKPKDTQQS